MNKKRFKIGDWVHISKIATRTQRTIENVRRSVLITTAQPTVVSGQIIGIKQFTTGKIAHGGEFERNYLYETTTHVVWAVSHGMMNKPIFAFDEDVIDMATTAVMQANMRLPIKWTGEWSEAARQELSNIMSGQVRDSRGRWIA
jgi:hypothetical protein